LSWERDRGSGKLLLGDLDVRQRVAVDDRRGFTSSVVTPDLRMDNESLGGARIVDEERHISAYTYCS
jgi:hypothetical protein